MVSFSSRKNLKDTESPREEPYGQWRQTTTKPAVFRLVRAENGRGPGMDGMRSLAQVLEARGLGWPSLLRKDKEVRVFTGHLP